MRNRRGFTLIEMVVVLAVVAILAAILTPTIAKNLNDAKVARAANEAQVIGAAIGSFFKDVGRWPTSNGTVNSPDIIQTLYSANGTVPALDPGAVTDEEFWLSTGGYAATLVDTFENQLILNTPEGGAVPYTTLSTSELRWRGPYITEIKADPWGSQYACNIWYTYNTTANFVGIWSAGPDRAANTDSSQLATAMTLGGDDILFRIQ